MKTKKQKPIDYSRYKTTTGYIKALAKPMRDIIIQHYKDFQPVGVKKLSPSPADYKTDDEIMKLFIKQTKAAFKELGRTHKLKKSEQLKKPTKKRWATKSGAKRAIESALRSGHFANVEQIYGDNVVDTLKEAGLLGEFKKQLAAALNELDGGKRRTARIEPLNFKPAEGSKGKSQTVLYIEDGTVLIELQLTWSPASVTIINKITRKMSVPTIDEEGKETYQRVDAE